MSLGIKLEWRALRTASGISVLSSVPRAPFARSLPLSESALPPRQRFTATKAEAAPRRDSHASKTGPETVQSRNSGDLTWSASSWLEDVPQFQSALVQPFVPYRNERMRNLSYREHLVSAGRQQSLNDLRARKGIPPPDWRRILDELRRWTPQRGEKWTANMVKVVIPPEAVEELTSRSDASIWDIELRTGCRLVLQKAHEPDGSAAVFLSGDEYVLVMAIREIAGLVHGALLFRNASTGRTEVVGTGPSILTVTDENNPQFGTFRPDLYISKKLFKRYALTSTAEEVPVPAEWTTQSFHDYVASLTFAQLPASFAIKHYGSEALGRKAIIDQLQQTFRKNGARASLSNSALRLAMAYMVRFGEPGEGYRNAQLLLDAGSGYGVPITTGIYNILLEDCVQQRDLGRFRHVLWDMSRNKLVPDFRTWILFLRIIDNIGVKRHIVEAMDALGLLVNPRASRYISREMSVYDMHEAIEASKTIDNFLMEQEERYGKDWRTPRTMNHILLVLSRHGRFSECLELLDHMLLADNCRPNRGSAMAILPQCKEQQNARAAIEVLQRMERARGVRLDCRAYEELFRLGWKMCLPNFMAVIWHYACINSEVSAPMIEMVRRLQESAEHEVRLVGKRLQLPRFLVPALVNKTRPDLSLVVRGPGRCLTSEAACAYLGLVPRRPLSEVLSEAWRADLQFHHHMKICKNDSHISSDVVIPLVRPEDPTLEVETVTFGQIMFKPSISDPFLNCASEKKEEEEAEKAECESCRGEPRAADALLLENTAVSEGKRPEKAGS